MNNSTSFLTLIFLGCGKRRLVLNRLLRTRPSIFFTPATCLLGLPPLSLRAGVATGATVAVAASVLAAAATAALAGFSLNE